MVRFLEACAGAISSENAKTTDAQLRAQELSRLAEIMLAWPKLSAEFRIAMQALTRSV
jgi:hypothetical protein